MLDLFLPPTTSTALFSDCQRYRYTLTRTWSEAPSILWVMLNPSTADAEKDDPTVRRCINFSRLWGAGGIVVVNIFALRATDPAELVPHYDVRGWHDPENDRHIVEQARGRRVIAAWGCHGALQGRGEQVRHLIEAEGNAAVECLGVTKDGYPKHPLYVAGRTEPTELTKRIGHAQRMQCVR